MGVTDCLPLFGPPDRELEDVSALKGGQLRHRNISTLQARCELERAASKLTAQTVAEATLANAEAYAASTVCSAVNSYGGAFSLMRTAMRLSPEGQEHNDLISDLFLRHVFRDEQNVVDSRADGLLVGRGDEARHRLVHRRSLVGETNHRVPIVRNENPVFRCRPS